jgi:hypothetical protein
MTLMGVEYRRVYPEHFSSGDIFWVPKATTIDCVAFILTERFDDNYYFGLTTIIGHKAGRRVQSFPNECKDKNGYAISEKWLSENWDKWVGFGNYEDAIFLRPLTRIQ